MAFDPQKDSRPDLASLKTGSFERNLALTRLGLGAGGKIFAHSLANMFRGEGQRDMANRDFYQRQAQILADELGRLKGSVMKAGQLLSLYGQFFLPPEAVLALAQLEDDTTPVSWKMVGPILEKSIGTERLRDLDIDQRAMAAASLGQVHRARRRSDGLELCVKIQYPGVADSVDSDIRTLSRLLIMSRLAPKGLDLEPVFSELREMLMREVDYTIERRYTEEFSTRLAQDPRFAVPRVLGEYSSDRVLTMTYEAGVAIKSDAVAKLSQERRNRLALGFFEIFLTEFFEWGMVQTDPHFGNYRIRLSDDGRDRIVLLDFGATRIFDPQFVSDYRCLMLGAVRRDPQILLAGAYNIGMMQKSFPEEVRRGFIEMCETIVEPFRDPDSGRIPPALLNADGQYKWGESDLPLRVAQIAARNALSRYFRIPPREIIFLHRRLMGVFAMLAKLRAELNLREQLLAATDAPPAAAESSSRSRVVAG
jgi:predicted unusual protein kinase regulating ubiquinone biosynthesis (AarF/ABC1/UbiB family)